VSIENNGTTDDDLITGIYKNIGLMEFGLRLPLGFDVCDFDKHIAKLRCFENDSVEYHFVNYPCDSTWLTVSIHDPEVTNEIVYPNPTSGIIHISGNEKGVPYELYNLQGVKIQSGVSENGEISIDQQGMFILSLFQNSKWIIRKIAVIP
jgi:Secretion system C-terminal sorting domain